MTRSIKGLHGAKRSARSAAKWCAAVVGILVLGAGANFAVAFYGVSHSERPANDCSVSVASLVRMVNPPKYWGQPERVSALSNHLLSMQYAHWSGRGDWWMTTTWQYGWPFRSLRRMDQPHLAGRCGNGVTDEDRRRSDQLYKALVTDTDKRVHVAWRGALLNTVVYSSVFGVLACAPLVLGRRPQGKPGHCMRCGYQVLDLKICPECGTPTHLSVLEPKS
jgi:hypothetical protein